MGEASNRSLGMLLIFLKILVSSGECLIFMEYCHNGDLQYLLTEKKNEPFSHLEACSFLYQTCLGLKVLHDAGIIHRDIKPENILLSLAGMFKIGDFSISKFVDSVKKTMTLAGTLGYIAPEILEGGKEYSNKVDIYALGCILYLIIFGYHPFSNSDGSVNQRLVFTATPVVRSGGPAPRCSIALQNLARKMIDTDPTKRPSAEQILVDPEIVAAFPLLFSGLAAEIGKKTKEVAELQSNDLLLHVCQTHSFISQKENQFEFLKDRNWHSLILNPLVTKGIYQCVIRLSQDITFGCCVASALASLKETWIGAVPGSCVYNGWKAHAHLSIGTGHENPDYLPLDFNIVQGDKLTAELNNGEHTLHFWHNETLLPQSLRDVPLGLYFGFCGSKAGGVVVEFVALKQLAFPSHSLQLAGRRVTASTQLQWK